MMPHFPIGLVLTLTAAALLPAQAPPAVKSFLSEKGQLTAKELTRLNSGQAVAKILSSDAASIYVLGIVYVKASTEAFLKYAADVNRLRVLPEYLGLGKIHPGASVDDLSGFVLEPDDIRELRKCKPGSCEVQLPGEVIDQFRKSVDWSRPDAVAQVNFRTKAMALELIRRYQQGGNRQLGSYADRAKAIDIAQHFQALLGGAPQLDEYLPELKQYLLDFPAVTLPRSESMFYWERVSFGLKPTLRLNHAVTYSARGPRGDLDVFAIKQLYASHYLRVALDLSVCLRDGPGFYLVTLKGSSQDGLTGFYGSIIRSIITNRTRASQESILAGIKKTLELEAGRPNK